MFFVFIGTKEQCSNSVSLIEKSNNNNKEQNDTESDTSNHLIIDDQSAESEDDDNSDKATENEGIVLANTSISQKDNDIMGTSVNSAIPSMTNSVDNQPSPVPQPTTVSSYTNGKLV